MKVFWLYAQNSNTNCEIITNMDVPVFIELYFKYGKKLAPVVREPGYPSKRNLRRLIRSWEADGGAKESIRHKPRYTNEQKQVAVEHYLNHGCCLAFTSRTLGYPCTDVLARWVNERYPDRRRIFTSKTSPVAPFEPEVKRQAVVHDKYQPVPGVFIQSLFLYD